jgi:enamine deaminase RidA (YjgF/YER057c/UK114 family)
MRKVIVAREFPGYLEKWHFAPVLDTGELVFFSGITGVRPDLSVSDDPETQFRDAFRFVAMHLNAAGLHFGHVVEMTTYHVRLRTHLNGIAYKHSQYRPAAIPPDRHDVH